MRPAPRLSPRPLVVTALLAAILLLAQISLSFLPNIELVTLLLLCYTAVFPLRQALGAVLVFANMLFQSLGCSWRASFLAVCRQGLFFIPLIFLLPRLFDLTGLEMTQMVADFITFLCSGGMLLHFFRTELAREGEKSPAPAERKM